MNIRALSVGALGFLVALGAERLYASLAPDIERYNKMRAMSGDPPMFNKMFSVVGSLFGSGAAGAGGMITGITNDLVRYAKMRGM